MKSTPLFNPRSFTEMTDIAIKAGFHALLGLAPTSEPARRQINKPARLPVSEPARLPVSEPARLPVSEPARLRVVKPCVFTLFLLLLLPLPLTAGQDNNQHAGAKMDMATMQQGDMFLVKKNIDGYQVSFHVMRAIPGMEHGGTHNFMVKIE